MKNLMQIYSLLLLLLFNIIITPINSTIDHITPSKEERTKNEQRQLTFNGRKNRPTASSYQCTREVYSTINPNPDWSSHPFHSQVWYHTLSDIHGLWQEGYFDYVLDIRPLETINAGSTGSMVLEGWQDFHIPGSYPINVYPANTPASEVKMLVDFTKTNVCKDSRIFVHCWSGISGNRVAKTLIELGFTNVHAAGPQGSAGVWDWKEAGYELVYGDVFVKKKMKPKCFKKACK